MQKANPVFHYALRTPILKNNHPSYRHKKATQAGLLTFEQRMTDAVNNTITAYSNEKNQTYLEHKVLLRKWREWKG